VQRRRGRARAGGQPQVEGLAQQSLVVQYDHNGDGEPDWLTVDTSESPFTIVEVLEGVPNAQPFDATAVAAGTPIDPEISQALADHIANSLNVVERTELDVRDAAGEPVRVVVFE